MIPALLAAALVWLPPATFTQWSKVDGLLRAHSDVKLTIALTPAMATPLAKAALAPWAALGRVEIAARVQGDPVLPLVAAYPAAPRPDDALERSVEARDAVGRRIGVAVAGFVPGRGALDPSLVDPLGASGASWVLTGPYEIAGGSWAANGAAVFVPARDAGADLTAPGTFVVDESAREDSSLLPALAALGRRPAGGWALVSELVQASSAARADAESIAAWPDWAGTLEPAPADPSGRAAWKAYGEAATTLARYQDSGAANLKVLERATLQLRKAQDARFFRAPASGAPAGLPADLRKDLLAVYKCLRAAAPDSLYAVGTSTGPTAAGDEPTSVRAASGSSWVSFDNPVGTSAVAPPGAPNADPWRLRGVRVEWDDRQILFRILPGRVDAAPAAPAPVYDVYVDLNHLAGAGSIRLLDGRDAYAQARDAWEFALTVDGTDARLWRAGTGDEPDERAKLAVERDPANAEIRVSVPRALLRGNPSRWGYIAVTLADGADQHVLGLLAPLEVQKTVLQNPDVPHRLPAVRLDAR